jgi:hypothetical protein
MLRQSNEFIKQVNSNQSIGLN